MQHDSLKVIIVGGSSGMGKGTAIITVKRGGVAMIVSRSAEKLESAKAEIISACGAGSELRVKTGQLDFTDEGAVKAFFEAIPEGLNCSPLSSVNGAVEGLTRALALELGPRLRVNCVSPGFVDTERFDHMPADKKQKMMESTAASLPLQRVGQREDIGEAVHFLLTNAFTTGVVLDCDGGHQIRQYASATNDPFRKK